MKRIFLLLLPIFLSSCSKSNSVSFFDTSISHQYDDVISLKIEWEDILSQKEKFYYVYIYSNSCGHCKEIKDFIIEYSINGTYKLYFIEYSDEIPVITNETKNLGITNYGELGIVGTPSLFEIGGGMVVNCHSGSSAIIETLTNEFKE